MRQESNLKCCCEFILKFVLSRLISFSVSIQFEFINLLASAYAVMNLLINIVFDAIDDVAFWNGATPSELAFGELAGGDDAAFAHFLVVDAAV